MYRFFVDRDQIRDGNVYISGDDVNHIRNVLRMKTGETILISCGDEWEYTCRITGLQNRDRRMPDVVTAKIIDAQKPGKELPSRIYLFQCLPKSDKMDWIVQKAVELGAFRIVPVESRRCIVRLDAKKAAARVSRWNHVAESAAKQSKRMIIPEVSGVMSLEEALTYADSEKIEKRFVPYERAEGMEYTRKLFQAIRPGQSVAILIGPEGGFEESEVAEAQTHAFQPVSLGKRILRTETAGMTALSILMYLLDT